MSQKPMWYDLNYTDSLTNIFFFCCEIFFLTEYFLQTLSDTQSGGDGDIMNILRGNDTNQQSPNDPVPAKHLANCQLCSKKENKINGEGT